MNDSDKNSRPIPAGYTYLLILPLLMLAFLLRWEHLVARIFHIDEYISILAALMTAQRGLPILPSGLLYHQGILVSFLTVPFVSLPGELVEEMARWPLLIAGMASVACYYAVARRSLSSWAAGLFGLAFAALDATMILWSGRARMYSLAGLFMLLGLYFLVQGIALRPRRRYRILAALCLLGAILSHSVAVVILPVYVLATVILVWVAHRRFRLNWYREKSFAGELVLIALILLIGVGFGLLGQIPFLSPSSGGESTGSGGILAVLGKFLDPGVSWQRVDDFVYYYTTPEYWPLLALGGLAVLVAVLHIARGRANRRDLFTLFLGLVLVLTVAELGLALTSTWRKTRYLFVLCQAPFLLLAADGLARLGSLLSALMGAAGKRLAPAGAVLGVIAIVVFWSGNITSMINLQGTGGYDTAFKWVGEQWQAGDEVMTVHPSAAYLYLGRNDYYAKQRGGRVMEDEESEELVDRYVGSHLVDSVETFNQALSDRPGRLWLVIDQDRLFSGYDSLFVQQIFAQMDLVQRMNRVLVLVNQAYPAPVPLEPGRMVGARFDDLIELGGYDVDSWKVWPDGTVRLTLFWRPLSTPFPRSYKVFVQLRNQDDQNVAQADHLILSGMLDNALLAQLREEGEWLRDSALLQVPPDLPAGTYRLMVGLYDPDTFERLPLVADQSGENAVTLEELTIP